MLDPTTALLLSVFTSVVWIFHILDLRKIHQMLDEIGRLQADQDLCPRCSDKGPALRRPSDPLH